MFFHQKLSPFCVPGRATEAHLWEGGQVLWPWKARPPPKNLTLRVLMYRNRGYIMDNSYSIDTLGKFIKPNFRNFRAIVEYRMIFFGFLFVCVSIVLCMEFRNLKNHRLNTSPVIFFLRLNSRSSTGWLSMVNTFVLNKNTSHVPTDVSPFFFANKQQRHLPVPDQPDQPSCPDRSRIYRIPNFTWVKQCREPSPNFTKNM